MRILVTGAAGFIGSHLADSLIEDGHQVVGIDNLSTGRRDNFPRAGELILGDIREELPREDWDVIYHCAASYRDRNAWELDASTNVLGTINVVREAKRTDAKLVYFQTSLCYGPSPKSPITIDAPLAPSGSYAVSKTAGESYIRDSGLNFVSLRLANIYGPRNLSGPPPTFYKRLSENQPCTVVDSRRDFVYIGDFVSLIKTVAERGRGIYHVSTGSDVAIIDIYRAVAKAMRIEAPEPTVIERGPDDVATILLDPSETYLELGWTARTPLITGMHKAVTWYRTHGVTETYTHLVTKG